MRLGQGLLHAAEGFGARAEAGLRAFDRKLETGDDITDHLDLMGARRPGHEQKRVSVDLPIWMIGSLDREAGRLGVPRQSPICVLVAERFERQGG